MDDIKDLIREALAQGFRVEQTAKGHWRFLPPDKTRGQVIFSGTPSDWRSFRNSLSQLIRAGFDLNRGKGKERS
jgi:hypothetical protein